jgi:hypothetical protein
MGQMTEEAAKFCCPKCRADAFANASTCMKCGTRLDEPARAGSSARLVAPKRPTPLIATVYSLTARSRLPTER